MASIPTLSFISWVSAFTAGVQGRAAQLIDFAVGAVLRAVGEGISSIALWLQSQALTILVAARLSTASGTDVDSFVGDFVPAGFAPRLPSDAATGAVTYTRNTAGSNAVFISNGSLVQTSDGTQQFEVVGDLTNANYSALLGGYTMPANASSITVLVQSITTNPSTGEPGTNGNIVAGSISVNLTSIVGIDGVSNASAFVNGVDGETDSALKARFALFILGLAQANLYGVQYALAAVSANIAYTITDQQQLNGAPTPGFFYTVVDDGSGSPPAAFVATAAAAVNARRALGVQCATYAVTTSNIAVEATLTTAVGYVHNSVVALVSTAISANITALGVGAGLPYGQIFAWIYAIPGVVSIGGLTLNSMISDIAPNPQIRLMPGLITVS